MKRLIRNVCHVAVALIFFCGFLKNLPAQEKPVLILPIGHTDLIRSVAFSPDGKYIATGSADMTLRIWDAASGKMLKVIEGSGGAMSVKYSYDGTKILTGNSDSTAVVYEAFTGKKLLTMKGHKQEVELALFSPPCAGDPSGGRYILTSSYDKTAILWDGRTGKKLHVFDCDIFLYPVACFSPDGSKVLTAGTDNTVKLWDPASGRLLKRIGEFSSYLHTASFNPDGKTIVTTSDEGPALVWDAVNGDSLLALGEYWFYADNATYSTDGKKIITTNSSYNSQVWDARTGEMLYNFEDTTGYISEIIFSPPNHADPDGGRYFLTMNIDNQAALYESESGKLLHRFRCDGDGTRVALFSPGSENILTTCDNTLRLWNTSTGDLMFTAGGNGSLMTSVCYSPDGSLLASSFLDGSLAVRETNTGKMLYRLSHITPYIRAFTFSPDGRYIASARNDSTAGIWDATSGRLLHSLNAHKGMVYSVQFSPASASDPEGGKYLLTTSADKSTIVWETASGKKIRTLSGSNGEVLMAGFSPDGTMILTSGMDSVARVWDATTGRLLTKLSGHHAGILYSGFSPDGKTAVTGSNDRTIKLWDAKSGKLMRSLEGFRGEVFNVAFSPATKADTAGGKYIAACSYDSIIKVWDGKTGALLHELHGHQHIVFSAVFSADARWLFTASIDKTIRMWDLATGRLLRTFTGHDGPVITVNMSPDGRFMSSGGSDSKVKMWEVATGKEIATLITVDSVNWIVIEPGGRFDGSREGMEKLYYTRGLEVIPLDAFFEKFYTPGLLPRLLAGETFESPGFDFSSSRMPPEVVIISPENNSVSGSSETIVVVEVTDRGGGIDEVRLYQNGKLLEGNKRAFKESSAAGSKQSFRFLVQLLPGENELKATAFNTERTEANPATVRVQYNGSASAASLYILAVGVNEYKNPKYNLSYAVTDAESFVSSLTENAEKIFLSVQTTLIKNTEAVKPRITEAFVEIQKKIQPQDVFVFYYAGHGVMTEGNGQGKDDYFLVLSDIIRMYDGPDELAQQCISSRELNDILINIKAQKQLVVLDACQSGGATEMFAYRGAAEEKAIAQLARSAGIVVLAATGINQYATEFAHLGHGVFTYALIEGLKGGADGGVKDQKITVLELRAWLDDFVPEITKKYSGEAQFPTGYSKGQDFPVKLIVK